MARMATLPKSSLKGRKREARGKAIARTPLALPRERNQSKCFSVFGESVRRGGRADSPKTREMKGRLKVLR
jgi:hypothetical protein